MINWKLCKKKGTVP